MRLRSAFIAAVGRCRYREVHALPTRGGETVAEKIVRELMRGQSLAVVELRKRRQSSHPSEISSPVP